MTVHADNLPRPADRRGLYPPVDCHHMGYLSVGDGHELYYEVSGNPEGVPVVFLHGGPGGGTSPVQRQFFDPARYRIVLFDQRGCGRSRPYASLRHNTTTHLLADIEKLRAHLGIGQWHVFGGSWGSTLALLYAQACPDRVLGLVLRGIFLMRQSELDWFYKYGTNAIFPDAWEDFIALIPAEERHDLIGTYYRRLTGEDKKMRLIAARAWARWESHCVTLMPDERQIRHAQRDAFALAFARIECHYFHHRGFLDKDDRILRDCHLIRHIPTVIVQGRYDAICPPRSAWDLKNALPGCTFRLVPVAGHSAFEAAIVHELVTATAMMADRTL